MQRNSGNPSNTRKGSNNRRKIDDLKGQLNQKLGLNQLNKNDDDVSVAFQETEAHFGGITQSKKIANPNIGGGQLQRKGSDNRIRNTSNNSRINTNQNSRINTNQNSRINTNYNSRINNNQNSRINNNQRGGNNQRTGNMNQRMNTYTSNNTQAQNDNKQMIIQKQLEERLLQKKNNVGISGYASNNTQAQNEQKQDKELESRIQRMNEKIQKDQKKKEAGLDINRRMNNNNLMANNKQKKQQDQQKINQQLNQLKQKRQERLQQHKKKSQQQSMTGSQSNPSINQKKDQDSKQQSRPNEDNYVTVGGQNQGQKQEKFRITVNDDGSFNNVVDNQSVGGGRSPQNRSPLNVNNVIGDNQQSRSPLNISQNNRSGMNISQTSRSGMNGSQMNRSQLSRSPLMNRSPLLNKSPLLNRSSNRSPLLNRSSGRSPFNNSNSSSQIFVRNQGSNDKDNKNRSLSQVVKNRIELQESQQMKKQHVKSELEKKLQLIPLGNKQKNNKMFIKDENTANKISDISRMLGIEVIDSKRNNNDFGQKKEYYNRKLIEYLENVKERNRSKNEELRQQVDFSSAQLTVSQFVDDRTVLEKISEELRIRIENFLNKKTNKVKINNLEWWNMITGKIDWNRQPRKYQSIDDSLSSKSFLISNSDISYETCVFHSEYRKKISRNQSMMNLIKSDDGIGDSYLQNTKMKTVKTIYEISVNNIEIQKDKQLEEQMDQALTRYEVESYDHFKEYYDRKRADHDSGYGVLQQMLKENKEIADAEEIRTDEYNIDLIEQNFKRIQELDFYLDRHLRDPNYEMAFKKLRELFSQELDNKVRMIKQGLIEVLGSREEDQGDRIVGVKLRCMVEKYQNMVKNQLLKGIRQIRKQGKQISCIGYKSTSILIPSNVFCFCPSLIFTKL